MTEKVTELLKKKNLDAILISDGYNMRYLSGFGGATGYLYISADQKVLMTDSRYTTQAKQEAPKFAVVEVSTEKGLPGADHRMYPKRSGKNDRF